jgi:hypothetical protein
MEVNVANPTVLLVEDEPSFVEALQIGLREMVKRR